MAALNALQGLPPLSATNLGGTASDNDELGKTSLPLILETKLKTPKSFLKIKSYFQKFGGQIAKLHFYDF